MFNYDTSIHFSIFKNKLENKEMVTSLWKKLILTASKYKSEQISTLKYNTLIQNYKWSFDSTLQTHLHCNVLKSKHDLLQSSLLHKLCLISKIF